MTAPVGTHSFTSAQSKAAEKRAEEIITTMIAKRPKFSLEPFLTYEDLLGRPPTYAYQAQRREPTRLQPDPGFILYRGRVAAIPEVKYQKANENAIERCGRWLAVARLPQVDLPLDRLFFAFYGPGFNTNADGRIHGATGGMVELCSHLPIHLVVNATDDEFRAEFKRLLDEIENAGQ